MMHPFKLITARLILGHYSPEDWERIHIYASSADFCKYDDWGPNQIEDTKKYVEKMIEQATTEPRYKFDFAVRLKENGLLMGGCGIRRESENSLIANMGWAINPNFQKKGYATEAAQALVKFGFSQLQLSIIYATCDPENVASYRVMEKVGMKNVGLIKKAKILRGEPRDSLRYEMIRSDSDFSSKMEGPC